MGYDQQVQAIEAEVRERNSAVDELESNFQAGAADAVEPVAEATVAKSLSRSRR